MIASPCLPRTRHGPSWLSITAGATHRALMCTEQVGTCLIHADLCLPAAASRSAVSARTLARHTANDHPGTSDHAIPADWDRRQISQVRARARHAAGRATSLPPETEPVRATRCGLPSWWLS